MRVGPVLGDQLAVSAQQGLWLDEEVPETLAGEQSCQPAQHRPVGGLQRRSVDLASEECHLVSEHDDLDRELRVAATGEADQLEDATERSIKEREGHRRMLAAADRQRQSAGHSSWMAFSAPTSEHIPESAFSSQTRHRNLRDSRVAGSPASGAWLQRSAAHRRDHPRQAASVAAGPRPYLFTAFRGTLR